MLTRLSLLIMLSAVACCATASPRSHEQDRQSQQPEPQQAPPPPTAPTNVGSQQDASTNNTTWPQINWSNWALALIGSGGVIVAIRTLRAIESQTKATEKAANAARDAAGAAIEGNRISRDVMIADQRPWIALDVEIAGPLAYDAEGWDAGVRWHVPVKYRLRHLGKAPATNVSFFGALIPFVMASWPAETPIEEILKGPPVPVTDVVKELQAVCDFPEAMTAHKMGFGQVMFPTDDKTQLFGLNGNPQCFDEVKEKFPSGYSGQFLVVVCATYGSTFSNDRYRTAKAFHLFKRSGTKHIDLAGETISIADLGFVLSPADGGSDAT
jgi:hypothetical protein